jgi:hypothetical protein
MHQHFRILESCFFVGLFFSVALPISLAFADTSINWVEIFGAQMDDEAYSIAMGNDGYVIAGITNSSGFGQYDAWLIKTDFFGLVEWNHTYGDSSYDVAHSVAVTPDGGYAFAGSTTPIGYNNSDYWLAKVDSLGNLEWTQTYDFQNFESCMSLISTTDGGFALLGFTSSLDSTRSFGYGASDVWLVKVDSLGNVEWNQTYGGSGVDSVSEIIETVDGGFALGCSTTSFGANNTDFWLVKVDSLGKPEWNQTYGASNHEFANSLVATSDGGYALAGSTGSFVSENVDVDVWLIKVNSQGNMEWNQTYGSSLADYCESMVISNKGGYTLACVSQPPLRKLSPPHGDGVFRLIETDLEGHLILNQTFGVSAHHSHTSMLKTNEGNYIFLGSTRDNMGFRDFWVAKISKVDQGWTELQIIVLLAVIAIVVLVLLVYRKSR